LGDLSGKAAKVQAKGDFTADFAENAEKAFLNRQFPVSRR
jgi:hypothetical protein